MRARTPAFLLSLIMSIAGCTTYIDSMNDDDLADDDAGDDDAGDDDTNDDDAGDDDTGDDDTGDDDSGDDDTLPCDAWVPGDFSTVQMSIDSSPNGSVICVSAGVYEEIINFGGKELRVVGVDGPEATIIDGDKGHPVVEFSTNELPACSMEGFTIAGGTSDHGGGIYISNASPTLRNLVLKDNLSTGSGGGIYAHHSDAVIDGVTFDGNNADDSGGALHGHQGGLALTSVLVLGNSAHGTGGGVDLWECDATISNAVFSGNSSGGNGGGFHVRDGMPTLTNLVVVGNASQSSGGGASVRETSPVFDNVVLAANSADTSGGGLYLSQGAAPLLRNLIVVHNSSPTGGGISADSVPGVSHCDVWSNTGGDYAGMTDPTGQNGNLSVDPLFVSNLDPNPLLWDLHLEPNSPLVNTGHSLILDPDSTASDMGAYGGPLGGSFDIDSDGYPEWWHPGGYDPSEDPLSGWDCDDRDPGVFPGDGC